MQTNKLPLGEAWERGRGRARQTEKKGEAWDATQSISFPASHKSLKIRVDLSNQEGLPGGGRI